MARKTDTKEAIEEILVEKEWELQRRFMREVARELGCYIPVETLMSCQNVALKWLEYVSKN